MASETVEPLTDTHRHRHILHLPKTHHNNPLRTRSVCKTNDHLSDQTEATVAFDDMSLLHLVNGQPAHRSKRNLKWMGNTSCFANKERENVAAVSLISEAEIMLTVMAGLPPLPSQRFMMPFGCLPAETSDIHTRAGESKKEAARMVDPLYWWTRWFRSAPHMFCMTCPRPRPTHHPDSCPPKACQILA